MKMKRWACPTYLWPLLRGDEMKGHVRKIYTPSLLESPARRLLSLQSLRQKYREGAH